MEQIQTSHSTEGANIPIVAIPTYVPIKTYLKITNGVNNGSLLNLNNTYSCLGGFFIIFFSVGLKLRAVAGGPSVTKFTHNN